MSDSKLERQFREKIDGHVSPIDPDALWKDIQLKQNDGRRSYKWIYLSLLVGTALILFYMLLPKMSLLSNKNTLKEKLNSTEIIDDKTNKESSNDHLTKEAQQNIIKLENNLNTKTNTITSFSSETNLSETAKNGIDVKNNLHNQEENTKLKANERITKNNQNINPNGLSSRSSQDSKSTSSKDLKIESLKDKSNNEILPANSNLENKTEHQNKKHQLKSQFEQEIQFFEQDEKAETTTEKLVTLLNTIPLNIFNEEFEKPILKNIKALPNKKMPSFEIGASFNYDLVSRKISVINEDSFRLEYAQLREASERFIESYNAGLFLRKNLKAGFRLTTGIGFAQLTERFDSNIVIDSIFIPESLNSQNGIIETTVRSRKIHNRYRSINVPLTIGKTIRKNNWSFSLDVGALWTMQLEPSGSIYSNHLGGENFTKLGINESNTAPQDMEYTSWLINGGLGYRFDNGIYIEVGPRIHSSFKSKLIAQQQLVKRHYFGLKCSLSKSF